MKIFNPTKLGFDPNTAKRENPTLDVIFSDDIKRTLWLAWKQGHIVSQYFDSSVVTCGDALRKIQPPISEDDLIRCLCGPDFSHIRMKGPWSHEEGPSDVEEFAKGAIRFFDGSEEMKFEVVIRNADGRANE